MLTLLVSITESDLMEGNVSQRNILFYQGQIQDFRKGGGAGAPGNC